MSQKKYFGDVPNYNQKDLYEVFRSNIIYYTNKHELSINELAKKASVFAGSKIRPYYIEEFTNGVRKKNLSFTFITAFALALNVPEYKLFLSEEERIKTEEMENIYKNLTEKEKDYYLTTKRRIRRK